MNPRTRVAGLLALVLTASAAFGQHDHGAESRPVGERVVKEVTVDTLKATGEVPPVIVGKPFTLRLTLLNASTGQPISGASAMVHMDLDYTDDDGRSQTISQSFTLDEVQRGVYEHRDRFAVGGPLTIAFHVTEVDSVALTVPIDLSVETEVSEPSESEQRPSMHGMHGMMSYGILGGAVVAVMILGMIFGRGWH